MYVYICYSRNDNILYIFPYLDLDLYRLVFHFLGLQYNCIHTAIELATLHTTNTTFVNNMLHEDIFPLFYT